MFHSVSFVSGNSESNGDLRIVQKMSSPSTLRRFEKEAIPILSYLTHLRLAN